MTTANPSLTGTSNIASAQKSAGNSAGRDSAHVPAAKKAAQESFQLPALVELAYTVSALLVIVVTLIVGIISLAAKASLIDLIIRTSVAILLTGGISMLVSWQVSQGALKASIAEIEEEEKKLAEEKNRKIEEGIKKASMEHSLEFDDFSNENEIEEK